MTSSLLLRQTHARNELPASFIKGAGNDHLLHEEKQGKGHLVLLHPSRPLLSRGVHAGALPHEPAQVDRHAVLGSRKSKIGNDGSCQQANSYPALRARFAIVRSSRGQHHPKSSVFRGPNRPRESLNGAQKIAPKFARDANV